VARCGHLGEEHLPLALASIGEQVLRGGEEVGPQGVVRQALGPGADRFGKGLLEEVLGILPPPGPTAQEIEEARPVALPGGAPGRLGGGGG
jgi:hypothetical protein